MTAIAAPLLAEPPLWTAARAMFERMRRAVGEAAELAERAWIGPKEKREIRGWLNPLIAMVRRLVLIEAIALLRAPAPKKPPRRRAPQRAVKAKRAAAPRPRNWSLRLWPKERRTGPRVRQLGPPLLVRDIWRDKARAAAAHHLDKVRFMRPPPALQFARRIDALAAILDRPLAAARRLARKLRAVPRLVLKLIRPLPRAPRYKQSEAYKDAGARAFNDSVAMLHPDTS